jgi:hypothetical protein
MKRQLFYIYILSVLFWSIKGEVLAQNNGYAGKRFLLKTDALHGIKGGFTGLELEVMIARHTTLTLGGKYYTSKVAQRYRSDVYPSYASYAPELMSEKAKVRTVGGTVEVRQYLNFFRPAPHGFFAYTSLYMGVMDVEEGLYSRSLIEYDADNFMNYIEEVKYRYLGVPFVVPEFGVGYQAIFKKRFSVGAKTGVSYSIVRNDPYYIVPDKVLEGVKNTFAGNLFNNLYFGFSGYVQVGYLIF